jgi:hypothetical protein
MATPTEPLSVEQLAQFEYAGRVDLDEYSLAEVATRADELQGYVLLLVAEVRRLSADRRSVDGDHA